MLTECIDGTLVDPDRSRIVHGSTSGYGVAHCRGPACTAKWREYNREQARRKRAELRELRKRVRELEAATA